MQTATHPHRPCPECGDKSFQKHESDGVIVCESCHAVVEERLIDHGPEWRSFQDDETNPERTGAPVTATRHDRGLSTDIGYGTDGYDTQLSSSQQKRVNRMRWIQEREGMDKHDRTLRFAFSEIDRMTSALDLPDAVHEDGCRIFRKAKAEELLPGWSIEGIASAVVALAAKDHAVFRSYDEISSVSRVDVREIKRAYLKVNRELNLGIEPVVPLDHYSQVLGRIASTVDEDELPDNFRPKIPQLSRKMLTASQDQNLHVGKSPSAFAAAAVYAALYDMYGTSPPITQKDVANVVDVSPPTIRDGYQEILENWKERKSVQSQAYQPDDEDVESHSDSIAGANPTEEQQPTASVPG